MGSLTHAHLPRSMYLSYNAIAFKTPNNPFPKRSTNTEILNTLGLGTVHFKPLDTQPEITSDYQYHTNTEVITSIEITADKEYSPDNMGKVTFEIKGKTYTKHYVSPEGGTQLVWVRWTTPEAPEIIQINAYGNSNELIGVITANVVEIGRAHV